MPYLSAKQPNQRGGLNSLTLAAGAKLEAPSGYTLTVTDGGTDVTSTVGGTSSFSSTGEVIISVAAN